MTQLSLRNSSELRDALLFFARLENRQLERDVEHRGHVEEYRTIVLASQAIYSIIVLCSSFGVLTPDSTMSYTETLAYDVAIVSEGVENFGARLRAVRQERNLNGPAVARQALGPRSTPKQRVAFANYLSRIERENVDVGFELLQKIAKGLGFPNLSAFLLRIEHIAESDPSKNTLPARTTEIDNSREAATPVRSDDHAVTLPGPVDLKNFERIAYGAILQITGALDRLGERLTASGALDEDRRPPTSRRRGHPGQRSHKTA